MLITLATTRIETTPHGAGDLVILLPFLGRSTGDFKGLAQRLTQADHKTVGVNPRGVGQSEGSLTKLTLHDYATDVAHVIEAYGGQPAHIIGYTFGNRVARCLAVDRPELVRSVILLAAGGQNERVTPPHMRQAIHAAVEAMMRTNDMDQRRTFLQRFYFAAESSIPPSWLDDWWPEAGVAQLDAMDATPLHEWGSAGNASILVIQGLEDKVAPPSNGYALREAVGDRVQVVDVPHAGHALLPEQPERVIDAIIAFLQQQ